MQLKFPIVDKNPKPTALINYAVCPRFDSELCQLQTNNFQVLIETGI